MELVEGPTLGERLRQGAMPLEDALPIARQMTETIEYAHERGIVHRDLKPSNVKLTSEGAVKVLDFGLAKALELVGWGLHPHPMFEEAEPFNELPDQTLAEIPLQ